MLENSQDINQSLGTLEIPTESVNDNPSGITNNDRERLIRYLTASEQTNTSNQLTTEQQQLLQQAQQLVQLANQQRNLETPLFNIDSLNNPSVTTAISDISGSTDSQKKIHNNLIKVCQNVVEANDKEDSAMISIVRKCVKDDVWPDTKFLSTHCINNQKFDDEDKGFSNGVVGKLLKKSRQLNLNILQRVSFWNTFSSVVKEELNTLKTTRSKAIKDALVKGKYMKNFIHFRKIKNNYLLIHSLHH